MTKITTFNYSVSNLAKSLALFLKVRFQNCPFSKNSGTSKVEKAKLIFWNTKLAIFGNFKNSN